MRRLINWFPKSTSRPARKHRARLSVSKLEAREMMDAGLVNGVLTVTGDDGDVSRNDIIEILSPVDGQMIVRVNGAEQFSGSNAISKIIIDGENGSDQVRIRGIQSGITDGVEVLRSETVTLGVQNPNTGLFTLADIRSDVHVQNATNLSLQDTGSAVTRTVVVGEQEITGLAPGRISYSFGSGATMSIQSGSGVDTFQIDRTPGARTVFFGGGGADTFDLRRSVGEVEINGQGGADVINIASTGQTLGQIFSRVTINDNQFQDRVTIDDRRTAENNDFFDSYTATLTSNQLTLAVGARTTLGSGQVISRSFNRTIDLNGVDSVAFRAATRAATSSLINVRAVNTFTETDVDVGGVATTRVGSTAGSLTPITGRTTFTGGSANSLLVMLDSIQALARTYDISAGQVRRADQPLGQGAIRFGEFLGAVEVRSGSANDRFNVSGLRAGGRQLTVDGNGGFDTVAGPSQANTWVVNGTNRGTLDGQVTFVDSDNLLGTTADDTYRFVDGGSVSGRIDGGGGFDVLDYSARTLPVSVNLGTGLASGVGGGAAGRVTGILNAFGGAAGDTLIGNGLNNVLAGNGGGDVISGGPGGRDILIGGTHGDLLTTGGSGDTIYIGGDVAAADRNNVASMKAILTEWAGPNTYEARVANLAAGVGPGGSVRLSAAALDGDNARDEFSAGSGRDVFYREPLDVFSGTLPAANEQVITV